MKKQIAIVELYEHHEVVRVLAKLFTAANYKVSIFAKKTVIHQLGALNATFVVKSKAQSQKEFIRKQMDALNNSDLILFTTLVKYPKFFALLNFKPKTILLIHDGNYFLRPSQHIKINTAKDIVRWLKFKILQEEKYRKQLLQHFSYVTFADDFITQNLPEEIKSLNINVLPALPLTYFEELGQPDPENPIIIIPGSVSPTRDYQLVFKAFRQIENKKMQPVELVLLGSAQSAFAKKIITQYQTLTPSKTKLTYFSTEVSQETYDDYLRKASFAIIPIKPDFVGGIFTEVYGKTKITGSVNDVVRFGVPTLISHTYPELPDLFQSYHNSKELGEQIVSRLGSNQDKIPLSKIYDTKYAFDKQVLKIKELAHYFVQ